MKIIQKRQHHWIGCILRHKRLLLDIKRRMNEGKKENAGVTCVGKR